VSEVKTQIFLVTLIPINRIARAGLDCCDIDRVDGGAQACRKQLYLVGVQLIDRAGQCNDGLRN
jgi:hypothetical protein